MDEATASVACFSFPLASALQASALLLAAESKVVAVCLGRNSGAFKVAVSGNTMTRAVITQVVPLMQPSTWLTHTYWLPLMIFQAFSGMFSSIT